jgi:hypothetical protein
MTSRTMRSLNTISRHSNQRVLRRPREPKQGSTDARRVRVAHGCELSVSRVRLPPPTAGQGQPGTQPAISGQQEKPQPFSTVRAREQLYGQQTTTRDREEGGR